MLRNIIISILDFIACGLNDNMTNSSEYTFLMNYAYRDYRQAKPLYVSKTPLPYNLVRLNKNSLGQELIDKVNKIYEQGSTEILCAMGTDIVDLSSYGVEFYIKVENWDPTNPKIETSYLPFQYLYTKNNIDIYLMDLGNDNNIETIKNTIRQDFGVSHTKNNIALIIIIGEQVKTIHLFDIMKAIKDYQLKLQGVIIVHKKQTKHKIENFPPIPPEIIMK